MKARHFGAPRRPSYHGGTGATTRRRVRETVESDGDFSPEEKEALALVGQLTPEALNRPVH
jgi:hypothetical protein